MPCRDELAEEEAQWRTRQELDQRTQSLCRAMKILEEQHLLALMLQADLEWWEEHKRFDREREQEQHEEAKRQHLRSEALAKLLELE